MSEYEKLMQAAIGLSDADLATLTALAARLRVTMAPPSGDPLGHLTREELRAADEAMSELIALSQEMGGYTVEGSNFPR